MTLITPQAFRRMVIALLVIAIVGGAAVLVGIRIYERKRHEQNVRLIAEARTLLANGDLRGASIRARRALQVEPDSTEALRAAAELAQRSGSREAVRLRQRVVELERDSMQSLMEWAETALKMGEPQSAKEALGRVPAKDQESVAFHRCAVELALAEEDFLRARSHCEKVLSLDPSNEACRFVLARLQLVSADPAARDAGRRSLEEFQQAVSAYRLGAIRLLLDDAARWNDTGRMLQLARELRAEPAAAFTDRLLVLSCLQALKRPDFAAYLSELQAEAADTPDKLARLLFWMNSRGLALLASHWVKSLPQDALARQPVMAAVAESYAKLRDWKALQPLVEKGDWGPMEFLRHAYSARVLREQGLEDTSRAELALAIKGGVANPVSISMLQRLLAEWGWQEESAEILASIAFTRDGTWALLPLQQYYRTKGDTAGLYRVSLRMLELQPENIALKNNVAQLALLLGRDTERAHRLAHESHEAEPRNAAYLSTYAFSLHLQQRTADAVALMKTLDQSTLRDPGVATYFGILLAADPATAAEARPFLDLASQASLQPEEKAMIEKAHRFTEQSDYNFTENIKISR